MEWSSVRMMLILLKLHKFKSKSIDFALACSKYLIKSYFYLFSPTGIKMKFEGINYVLNLKQKVHGLKDRGRMW